MRMIETIPNPLTDQGVKRDIEDKVNEILSYKGQSRDITQFIKELVTAAAKWGYQTGFRTGWKVYEVTKGGAR